MEEVGQKMAPKIGNPLLVAPHKNKTESWYLYQTCLGNKAKRP